MTEPLFLDLQYAPQSGVVLPAGVVVRSRIVANEKIFLEIAAESSWNAVGVWIKNLRGKPIGHTVLQNRITPEGSFSHGEIPLVVLPRLFRLDLMDSDESRITAASFGVDTARHTSFAVPEFDGMTGVTGISEFNSIHYWGPPGNNCHGVVNLLRIQTSYSGIDCDLLVDDAGKSRFVELNVPPPGLSDQVIKTSPSEPSRRLPLIRMFRTADSPRRVQFSIPLGTAIVDLDFIFEDDTKIAELSCRLELASLRFSGRGDASSTRPIQREEATRRIAEALAQPLTRSRTTRRVKFDLDLNTTSTQAPARGVPGYLPNRVASETSAPRLWPDVIGDDGAELGPPGALILPRTLQLVDTSLTPAYRSIEITVDDSGIVRKIALGQDGRLFEEKGIVRSTPTAPGSASLKCDREITKCLMFCFDRFGDVLPDLSAVLNLESGTFEKTSPSIAEWHPQIRFRASLTLAQPDCVMCSTATPRGDLTLLTDLPPEDRRAIRSRFAPSPESPGICRRCLPILKLKLPGAKRSGASLMDLEMVGSLLIRAGLALIGNFLPATRGGVRISQWLSHPDLGIGDPVLAVCILSVAGGAVLFSIPLRVFVFPMFGFFRRYSEDSGRVLTRRSVAGLFCAFLAVLATDGISQNLLIERSLFLRLLPLTTMVSVVVSLAGLALFHFVHDLEYEVTMVETRRLNRLGELWLLLSKFRKIERRDEFRRLLGPLIQEGFGATGYAIFCRDSMSDRFEPDKVWPEGKKLPEGFDASMVLGSLGRALRAECPQLGHRVQDDRADSTGQLQVTDPYEFVLPVMFNHKIELLIAVDSLIDNSTGEDLALVIDDLMLILSASFSRCQPDSDASMTPVGLSAHAGDSSDE